MFRARFISGLRDFTRILTSGILRARLVREIWIHSADKCILAISCVGYYRNIDNHNPTTIFVCV